MQLKEERMVPVPRDQVWEALLDDRILRACIPGCDYLKRVSPVRFDIHVGTRIGPVSAMFKGAIRLENVSPPDSYKLVTVNKDDTEGVARGEARIKLSPIETHGRECTVLSYTIEAVIGGRLARFGARLVDGVATRMANQFFEEFIALVSDEYRARRTMTKAFDTGVIGQARADI
jgi:carbon monoxide dehydrogenase subunit G